MHKLLVPVDGSDNAMRALEHAIRLAREKEPMELVIVYAHEPPIIYGEIEIYLSEEKAKELVREHSEDILRPSDREGEGGRDHVHQPNPDRQHSEINCLMRRSLGLRRDCDGNTRHECDRQSRHGVCCNEGYSPHQSSGHAREIALGSSHEAAFAF